MRYVFKIVFCLMVFSETHVVSKLYATPSGDVKEMLSEIKGTLFFHRYSSYEALDSKLFMLDLESYSLTELSKEWDIIAPMNAHISPDARSLTFMGVRPSDRKWAVYLWNFDENQDPQNISGNLFDRNEDPKFSPDGQSIIFKCDGNLCQYDYQSGNIEEVLDFSEEVSMPYYHPDSNQVIFSSGARASAEIGILNIANKQVQMLEQERDVQEYYPIFMGADKYLYARWASKKKHNDQIYVGYLDSKKRATALPLNTLRGDYSDPYPVDDNNLFFSLNSESSNDGYNIHIGGVNTSAVYRLPSPVRSSQQDLGSCYCKERIRLKPLNN